MTIELENCQKDGAIMNFKKSDQCSDYRLLVKLENITSYLKSICWYPKTILILSWTLEISKPIMLCDLL